MNTIERFQAFSDEHNISVNYPQAEQIILMAFEAGADLLTSAKAEGYQEALQVAKKAASLISAEWWKGYKEGTGQYAEHRAESYAEGCSDGAEQVALAIEQLLNQPEKLS